MDDKNYDESYMHSTNDVNPLQHSLPGSTEGNKRQTNNEIQKQDTNCYAKLTQNQDTEIKSNDANTSNNETEATTQKNKDGQTHKKRRGRKPKKYTDNDYLPGVPTEGGTRKLKRPKLTASRAEAHRLAVARYNANNPEARRISVAKYAATHAEAHRLSVAKYNATHKEERKLASARYRAKKKAEKEAMNSGKSEMSTRKLRRGNVPSHSDIINFVEVIVNQWNTEEEES